VKSKQYNLNYPKISSTDFDGDLTDDRVWLNQEREEFIAAKRKDGLVVNRLKNLGIQAVITSTETNKVVTARGNKMGVEVLQGLKNKEVEIEKLKSEEVWSVVNDVNDVEAIEKAKYSLCASDSVSLVKKKVSKVLETRGGFGILSEIATKLENKQIRQNNLQTSKALEREELNNGKQNLVLNGKIE
jgi:3-deoxy-D-manno-octulosonate 8-phosphate phosphatase KdsC-like HAD superfamily phosphatase